MPPVYALGRLCGSAGVCSHLPCLHEPLAERHVSGKEGCRLCNHHDTDHDTQRHYGAKDAVMARLPLQQSDSHLKTAWIERRVTL